MLLYCLKTEVFLCCQITDILSENKNKTQCIAPASIREQSESVDQFGKIK